MKNDISRRSALKIAVSSAILLLVPSCATTSSKPPGPFLINTEGVEDLNGFIAAIQKAGAGYLPSSLTVEDYYEAFAKTFVDNARKAIDFGMQFPEWIIEKLPNKKVDFDQNDKENALIAVTLAGVVFLLPAGWFYIVTIASFLTLGKYIKEKLSSSNI